MGFDVGGRKLFLTYCTNVHPAETVEGVMATLDEVSVRVAREHVGKKRFGLGLWLARDVVDDLLDGGIAPFRSFLEARDLYVFTLNAFPYRGFHEARVKEKVFLPTWAEEKRRVYTEMCGDVLAELLPDAVPGSVSTMPLGLPTERFDLPLAIENLRRAAEHYAEIERISGRRIVLSVEPEPGAILSSIDDAAEFLEGEVFEGEDDPLRRHLGVCFDACHEGVMHRDLLESLETLRRRKITIGKVQVTSALELVDPWDPQARRRLALFDEGRYFHQAAYREAGGSLALHQDLDTFFAAADQGALRDVTRARVHFHVPIFCELEGSLRTLRDELVPFLAEVARSGDCAQFEVESYTFAVIPDAERQRLGGGDLVSLLVSELAFARAALRGEMPLPRGAR